MQNVIVAGVAACIIGTAAGYAYSAEQTRQAGFVFGNELLSIQEGAKALQSDFSSHAVQWREGDLTEREFADFAAGHLEKMGGLVAGYDRLEPPEPFEASVAVFRLSLESQLESDREYVRWIQTGDESHRIRSDALIQDAFEYEVAALGEFNRAKSGISAEP